MIFIIPVSIITFTSQHHRCALYLIVSYCIHCASNHHSLPSKTHILTKPPTGILTLNPWYWANPITASCSANTDLIRHGPQRVTKPQPIFMTCVHVRWLVAARSALFIQPRPGCPQPSCPLRFRDKDCVVNPFELKFLCPHPAQRRDSEKNSLAAHKSAVQFAVVEY